MILLKIILCAVMLLVWLLVESLVMDLIEHGAVKWWISLIFIGKPGIGRRLTLLIALFVLA